MLGYQNGSRDIQRHVDVDEVPIQDSIGRMQGTPVYTNKNDIGGNIVETRLVSVKEAAKIFNFPLGKLYQLVERKQVPFIELENLSGTKSNKINTRTFEDWLNKLATENQSI